MTTRERFAPSPTGPLHLGHAYSALLAHDAALAAAGDFHLRIEDIDQSRARPEWEAQIYDDLAWLGLSWPEPVLRQSDRMASYRAALQTLWRRGLIYPCTCNRRDIEAAARAPQEGGDPATGPDGIIYPGTCRPQTPLQGPLPEGVALRLNMSRAVADLPDRMQFREIGAAPRDVDVIPMQLITTIGDVVLARRDFGTSYHLSVVIDDAQQQITHITRGIDLFEATAIHVILQQLLGLSTPVYRHHRLIRDAQGKRLAKRHDAMAIAAYRDAGRGPGDIRRMVGL